MKEIFKTIIVHILAWQARMVLAKYKPKIVAVTGSVGKTSTKDAIYTVLSHFFHTRKSAKSFNSEIGVPLTILGVPNAWSNPILWLKNIYEGFALILLPNKYPQWLVLEVGVDKPGDMAFITKWLHPDITVVTRLSKVPVHVEFFPSVQDILDEKGKLVEAVKNDGFVVLNVDDEEVMQMKNKAKGRVVTFGVSEDAMVKGSEYEITYDEAGAAVGVSFGVESNNEKATAFVTGSLGEQYAYIGLAAVAVARTQNLPLAKVCKILSALATPPGRMRLLSGIKNTTLIDDTYNSSPVALANALRTLKSVKARRRVAVLGDMLELGKYSTEQHIKAGAVAAACSTLLVTVGLRSKFMRDGAIEAGMKERSIISFSDSRAAGEFLRGALKKGDVVLVKGSQSMRMERVTAALLAEPEKAVDLLVRQESDWQKR